MEFQGFIKSIGEPRQWNTRDGQPMKSAPIVLQVPQVDSQGRDVSDDILGEVTYSNDAFLESLSENKKAGKRVSCSVRFAVREYQGRQFPNIRIGNVTVLI